MTGWVLISGVSTVSFRKAKTLSASYINKILYTHQNSSNAMIPLKIRQCLLYIGNSRLPAVAQMRFPVAAQAAMVTAKMSVAGMVVPWGSTKLQ